jgi:DNA-binding response OmpR family regulator
VPRVLVLVAAENVRQLRRLVLQSAGFEVEAPEVSAALRLLESMRFDALVLGTTDGVEPRQLITAFRIRNPGARVVAVGASGTVRLMADATVDPFEPSMLIAVLRGLSQQKAQPPTDLRP